MRKGLGKGLQALIPETDTTPANEISIDEIIPNENQPRKDFDEEALASLTESVRQYGVLQPILVTPTDGGYRIVAGERRYRAAKAAGLEKIPAVVRTITEEEVMELALIENLQREDLNPIEEARAYRTLMEEYSLTQEEIAKIIGKSRPAIANSLRLLNLEPRVREFVEAGRLSAGHAKALLGVENPAKQYEVALKVMNEDLSVRETEKIVSKLVEQNRAKSKKTREVKKDPIIKNIEDRLEKALGTKVQINTGKKGGKIYIEYYSNEELERIIEVIGG
ncbi:ParB/RepB/Spo0J family partition protein [Calorimonas adulescens]|uniref:ParB/RepB/Spo0J family partition protein n=1 Tax=Calorimonas adulescens TaxID=2606906 RepID=A0A5D8Q997_9THEO|nr:ParB/RepB/Spo0J family partition protein [Calorimonas adulescens]TZE80754.1 ParB/RepB/Spo0J family partition protein [Calorimonas adulescens]